MSRRANCWDNAVVESFFATLKTELIHHADYQSPAEARAAIFEFIEVFYNRQRRRPSTARLRGWHGSLTNLTRATKQPRTFMPRTPVEIWLNRQDPRRSRVSSEAAPQTDESC